MPKTISKKAQDFIALKGVRTHNLKNLNIKIPKERLVVVTGVSGSGKSSLAIDTLYAEGQRRYVESLSSYARQFLERMEKPDLDAISGILPAIAIEAKNVITNARSTVGTQTEINDYLRVLFSRIGRTYCHSCGKEVVSDTPASIFETLQKKYRGLSVLVLFKVAWGKGGAKYLKEFLNELIKQGFLRAFSEGKVYRLEDEGTPAILEGTQGVSVVVDRLTINDDEKKRFLESIETAYRHGQGKCEVFLEEKKNSLHFSESFHCAPCDLEFKKPGPNMFLFNSPLGACPTCQGFGRIVEIDPCLVVPNESKTIREGAIEPWTKPSAQDAFRALKRYCQKKDIPIDVPWKNLSASSRDLIFEGDDNYFGVKEFFKYLEKKTYKMHVRVFLARYRTYTTCPDCHGSRLKSEALQVRLFGETIQSVSEMTLENLEHFFSAHELSAHEEALVRPVLLELKARLRFLNGVGLSYLTLDRLSRTLSGGEAQRINLATSLGSSLVDTLYVLDEPSIGLHERDNQLLINILGQLRDLGNTVVVIEHDGTMIRAADHVLDLGPGAGEQGGELLFEGTIKELLKSKTSITACYLKGKETISLNRKSGKKESSKKIILEGASENNLKKVKVEIPLGQFVVVTGVSGSGKSSLVYDCLFGNFSRRRGRPAPSVGAIRDLRGSEHISDMVLIDQSPVGRTPRSNPVTYVKAYDDIRKAFARTRGARLRRLTASDFSFNVEGGGRCPECEGGGKIKVEMHFLADIYIECEACQGTRFQKRILDVKYREKNIHEVLSMTVDHALDFFKGEAGLLGKLDILRKTGLGYLRLGQSALTLSRGEAQRLKLAAEMMDRTRSNVLYIFDEPTTGLHYRDIQHLMNAFRELLERGNSLLVIEHNMEVIKCADTIIDLGPEGGERGGEVIYEGPLAGILKAPKSYTGRYLRPYLKGK